MADLIRLRSDIEDYATRLERQLQLWQQWIQSQEEAYARGAFNELPANHADGTRLASELQSLLQERQTLIDRGSGDVVQFSSLTKMAKRLWADDVEFSKRLSQISSQAAVVQQRNAVMWFTAFKANDHLASVGRLISTGDSSTATYSPGEQGNREGGRLIDHAA